MVADHFDHLGFRLEQNDPIVIMKKGIIFFRQGASLIKGVQKPDKQLITFVLHIFLPSTKVFTTGRLPQKKGCDGSYIQAELGAIDLFNAAAVSFFVRDNIPGMQSLKWFSGEYNFSPLCTRIA